MKRPFIAFTFSFLLPGAGLAYLGKWKWAVINLAIVLISGILLGICLPERIFEKYVRLIAIGFGCASGAIAKTLAEKMNLDKNAANK